MITIKEFKYLANRSSTVFLSVVYGGNLNRGLKNMNAWQRATAAYAKFCPGNGQVDEVQERALAHAAELHKNLWKGFRKACCRLHQIARWDERGELERATRCANHGEEVYCHKAFEDKVKQESY